MVEIILGVLLLFVVQSFLPALFRYYLRADPKPLAALGPRDEPPSASTICLRSERALGNLIEAVIVFLPLALLTFVAPNVDQAQALLGAQIFLGARIAYVPAYLFGIPVLRSLVWIAGLAGAVIMALALL